MGASKIMPNKHIRVYELAKELNKTSKEIMAVLAEKNIEVTTHMATLEDNQAELVRGAVGSGQQEAKKEGAAPAKKIRSGTQSGEQQRQEESGASSADSEKRSKTCKTCKTGSGKAGNSTSWNNSVRRDNGSTCSINSSTETRRRSSTCSKTCKTSS